VYQALRETVESVEPLSCHVLKTPHHGSKHGVNIELIERCTPTLVLTSSKSHDMNYFFPHDVAQEAMREALQAIAVNASPRRLDWALGMLYTADTIADGAFAATTSDADDAVKNGSDVQPGAARPAAGRVGGSIALVGRPPVDLAMWRFCDPADRNVVLDNALRYLGPGVSKAGVP
jgi:hypothetical protein